MRKCFICDSTGICEHKETPLVPLAQRINRFSTDVKRYSRVNPATETDMVRLKTHARYAVYAALRKRRIIKPDNCDSCGVIQVLQAHHVDYTMPLVISWLCSKCHAMADRRDRTRWKTIGGAPVDASAKQARRLTIAQFRKSFLENLPIAK